MKHLFILSLFFIFYTNSFSQVKAGDKYNGIVKLTNVAAKNNINGKWDVADYTGNAAVDTMLSKYLAVNKSNTKAIAALENVSAEVKSNPEKFINPDGSVNKDALSTLLKSKFSGVGNITVPSTTVVADSNTNRGMQD